MHLPLLPLTGETAALHLAQRLGSAQEGDQADGANRGQGLEQVPAAVVEEEDALHGNDGTEKGDVRDGGASEGLLDVRHVGAEREPLKDTVSMRAVRRVSCVWSPGRTPINKAGTVARTASAKTMEMILGGFVGSARKMW